MQPFRKIAAALAMGLLAGWITGRFLSPDSRRLERKPEAPAGTARSTDRPPEWQSWLDETAPLVAPADVSAFWHGVTEAQNQSAPRRELARDEGYELLSDADFTALLTDSRFMALNPEKLQDFRTGDRSQWEPSWWRRPWQSGPAYAIRAAGTLSSIFLNDTLERQLSHALARTEPDTGLAWIQTLNDPLNPLADYLGTVASHDLGKARELWGRLPTGGPDKVNQATAASARRLAASALVREWAKSDWQAAITWASSHLSKEDTQQTMTEMLQLMEPGKSQEIMAEAAGIQNPEIRSLVYSHALSAESNGTLETLIDKALALPENALDKAGWDLLGQRSAGRIPRTADAAEEAARLRAMANRVPETFRQGFIEHAAMMAGWNNKPLAGQLLEYLPDGNAELMAGDWVQQDPMAASTWLAALQASPKRDAAVTGFCRALSPVDPRSAADWSMTVQDAARREKAVADAMGAWRQKDPEAAQVWAEKAGLDATDAER